MPNNADTTRISPVSSDDFICNKDNVLWLLGHRKFYAEFTSFAQMQRSVEELAQFMKNKGLTTRALTSNCTHCDAFKALRAQAQLVDGFARIFIWLGDNGRMQELRRLGVFVSLIKGMQFKRVFGAYSGPATKKKERLVIVE